MKVEIYKHNSVIILLFKFLSSMLRCLLEERWWHHHKYKAIFSDMRIKKIVQSQICRSAWHSFYFKLWETELFSLTWYWNLQKIKIGANRLQQFTMFLISQLSCIFSIITSVWWVNVAWSVRGVISDICTSVTDPVLDYIES